MSDAMQHAPAVNPVNELRFSGRRVVVALMCWLFSSYGIGLSILMSSGSFLALWNAPLGTLRQAPGLYVGLLVVYVWAALAMLTKNWVQGRDGPVHWSVGGGLVGLALAVYFWPASIAVLPCMVLGAYLAYRSFRYRPARHRAAPSVVSE